ncbi:hypothetical protein MPR_2420 [Myroides profundi]|nr:hypothetical protein MPR_2420 [Myroides profundi]
MNPLIQPLVEVCCVESITLVCFIFLMFYFLTKIYCISM